MTYELTILMPCLNEEKTVAFCINEAKRYIEESGVLTEILIADNGSSDDSAKIAEGLGARVVRVGEKGYGAAIRGGIAEARGRYIIMGDCDGSYDFYHLSGFMERLRAGNELVMGNRFRGGIERGAMPFSHKLGVPALSLIGRLVSGARVGDFHCGLRGFDAEKARALGLSCSGMELASEMICRFARSGAKICEIPTVLRKDKRDRKPHLRTLRDGWRHVGYLLMHKRR